MTFDVYRPARSNGASVISIVSAGWQSSVEMGGLIAAYLHKANVWSHTFGGK